MTQQFDELAALYEETAEWAFRKYCEIPSALDSLGDVSGLSILDFGCGSGFYARILKKRGAKEVVGYDISPGMISYARRREEKERCGVVYVDDKNDIPERHFDLVVSIYTLPYASTVSDLMGLCNDMVFPIIPGGRLVTLPLHPDYSLKKSYYRPYGIDLISSSSIPRGDGAPLTLHLCHPPYDNFVTAYYWSRKTLVDVLQKQGLKSIEWKDFHVTDEGKEILGNNFWAAYQERPHSIILSGKKGG